MSESWAGCPNLGQATYTKYWIFSQFSIIGQDKPKLNEVKLSPKG